jgi:hypothetical protein
LNRYLRRYTINITTPKGELVTVENPFTVMFTITRNTLASANNCELEIKELSPSIRSKLYKDRYAIAEYWGLTITAGYDKQSLVFQGNILECYSYKEGVHWITKIESFDGMHGIQNGFTSKTYNKNTDKKTIITGIVKDMPNIIQGVLGSPSEGSNPRGQVVFGQSSDVLDKQTGGKYFIDNEKLNVIDDDEYLNTGTITLDSNLLFSTPRRRDTFLDCETLFFPECEAGILCNLNSKVPEYNGQYKIMGFKHSVQISQESSGRAVTNISLYVGAKGLKVV